MNVRRLGVADRDAVAERLSKHPEENLFVRARIARWEEMTSAGSHVLGMEEGAALAAVAWWRPKGLVVPCEATPDAQRMLASLLESVPGSWRNVVARSEDAEAFVAEAVRRGAPLELDRTQTLMVVHPETVRQDSEGKVRLAASADLDALIEMDVQLGEEDLGIPRHRSSGEALRGNLQRRIERGEAYVAECEGEVACKVVVGTHASGLGAQVEGVFTHPKFRNRGLASGAMAAIARELLSECPFVTLHVAETNTSAIRSYEKAGFVRKGTFRMARRAPPEGPTGTRFVGTTGIGA